MQLILGGGFFGLGNLDGDWNYCRDEGNGAARAGIGDDLFYGSLRSAAGLMGRARIDIVSPPFCRLALASALVHETGHRSGSSALSARKSLAASGKGAAAALCQARAPTCGARGFTVPNIYSTALYRTRAQPHPVAAIAAPAVAAGSGFSPALIRHRPRGRWGCQPPSEIDKLWEVLYT
jgi:hypothetical protein